MLLSAIGASYKEQILQQLYKVGGGVGWRVGAVGDGKREVMCIILQQLYQVGWGKGRRGSGGRGERRARSES